jgi:hypothetical protein
MHVAQPLLPDLQLPVAVGPRQRPLHHPPMPAQTLARLTVVRRAGLFEAPECDEPHLTQAAPAENLLACGLCNRAWMQDREQRRLDDKGFGIPTSSRPPPCCAHAPQCA